MTDAAPVAMVNEEAARRFWPGRDPDRIAPRADSVTGQETWLEVVGVVGNLRNSDVDQGRCRRCSSPRPGSEPTTSPSW